MTTPTHLHIHCYEVCAIGKDRQKTYWKPLEKEVLNKPNSNPPYNGVHAAYRAMIEGLKKEVNPRGLTISFEHELDEANDAKNSLELILAFALRGELKEPESLEQMIGEQQDEAKDASEKAADEQKDVEAASGAAKPRTIYAPRMQPNEGDFKHPLPMMVVGTDDIMLAVAEKTTDGDKKDNKEETIRVKFEFSEHKPDTQQAPRCQDIRRLIARGLDSRYRFLDSSIWHRYVSVFPPQGFYERLFSVIEDMRNNHWMYGKIVAQEHLEFQCRKLKNSYFMDMVAGHSKKVTPYRFHSEAAMKLAAEEELKELHTYTWGCLVIDDYAQKPLRNLQPPKGGGRSKVELIEALLNQRSQGPPVVQILNAQEPDPEESYIRDGERLMKKYSKADLIFLDYFFGVGEPDVEQQYGHYLLRKILDDHKLVQEGFYKGGGVPLASARPFDKHWIFPISVFDHAFSSHLKTLGINRVYKHVEIADGADPVNTPQLFRYLVYSFLNYFLQTRGLRLDQLVDELSDLLEEKSSEPEAFRQIYPEVARLNTKISQLRKKATFHMDHMEGTDPSSTKKKSRSLFATTYLQRIDPNHTLLDLSLHFQHLTYLISYGLQADWPQMWEECQLIKKILKQFNYQEQDDLMEIVKQGMTILDSVEAYIISLQ